ncbi:hypothetical protein CEUSTIGMA_g13186.t1 [Chlamydomonas eustigma]|uniref:Uncharacterized protein n=1 Tax=Chlamydomonas eustigma TaxID=1157962 RepID=A0A250XRQ6_9CHLO|nr:hypothetical protein CEUSTIGMA_g13186.t1 [Chlamydomonas eustigma]|eukprot:GAX85771.1 hypothetical protein CEUSTIGMA_g13186.t1 [Chlamydomonas eustigma]
MDDVNDVGKDVENSMNRWSELPSDIALLIFKHLDHEAKQLHHPVTYFSTIDSEQEFSPTAIHNLRATCKPWKRVIDNATRRLLLCGHEKTVINSMNFPALEVLDTSLAEGVRLLPTAENSSQEEAHNEFLASSSQVVSPTVQIKRKPLLRNTGLEKRTTFSGRKSLKSNKHHMSKQQGSVMMAHYRPNLPRLTDLTINAAEISQISLIKTCPQLRSLNIDNKRSCGIANLPSATTSLRSITRALARALSSDLRSLSSLTFLHVDLLLAGLWESLLSLSLECLSLQHCPCPWFLAPQYNDRAITSTLILGHVLPGTTWTSASLRSTSGAWRPGLCTSPLAPLAATLTSLTLKACFLHPEDVYVKGPCGVGTLPSHKRVVGRRGNKRSRALASDNGGGTVPGGVVLQQQALQAEGASTSGTHGLHYLQQDENLSVDNLDVASEQSAPDGGVEEAAGLASAAAGQGGAFIGASGDDGQFGDQEALPISDLHARDFFQALQPLTKLQNLDLSNNSIGMLHSGIGHIR